MKNNYQEKYEQRIRQEIMYLCKYGYTIRKIASIMKISKSTVHVDLTKRLKKHSLVEYSKVRKVLDQHIEIRHIMGGIATREKYLSLKQK